MDQQTVTVSRDPFAREEVVRTIVPGHSCSWCGGPRWRNGRPLDTLFQYGVQDDNYRTWWSANAFCSKSCYDSYYS